VGVSRGKRRGKVEKKSSSQTSAPQRGLLWKLMGSLWKRDHTAILRTKKGAWHSPGFEKREAAAKEPGRNVLVREDIWVKEIGESRRTKGRSRLISVIFDNIPKKRSMVAGK